MTVLQPERDRRWDYRRTAVQRVEDAVRKMLVDSATHPLAQRSGQRPDQTSALDPTIYWQPVQELETRKCSTA